MLLGLKFNATKQAFEWQDGTFVDYAPQGINLATAPATAGSAGCMAVLANGTWVPVSCTKQPLSFGCNINSIQVVVSPPVGPCSAGRYITSNMFGSDVKWSLGVFQPPPSPSRAYLNVTASVAESWSLPGKVHFWKAAMLPLHAAAAEPLTDYHLPAPYLSTQLVDGSCQVSSVAAELYGRPAAFYVRIVLVPTGALLDVWGQVDLSAVGLTLPEGLLGPGGWVQALVQFVSISPAA